MELAIKNKWISLGGSSTVQDMSGNDVLKVKGKVFSFTQKKFVTDLNDNVKFIVRNKFWKLFVYRAFVMDAQENIIATVRRKVFSLHDRYFVTSPEHGDMEIIGNILQFNYKILKDGKEIGHVARKISLRDSYVLTIDDSFDYEYMVALVIAIDNITDRRDSDSSSSSFSSND